MSKIIIVRPHSFFAVVRNAKIFIDNNQIGTIKDNEQKAYELTPGIHTIKVGYGTFSGMSNTLEMNLQENEEITVCLNVKLGLYYLLMIVSFICGLLIYYGFISNNPMLFLIAIIILIPLQIIQTKKILTLSATSNNQ